MVGLLAFQLGAMAAARVEADARLSAMREESAKQEAEAAAERSQVLVNRPARVSRRGKSSDLTAQSLAPPSCGSAA